MRLESIPEDRIVYRTTETETIGFDRRSGEIASTYARRISPLDMWREDTKRKVAKAIQYHKGERRIAQILADGMDEPKYEAAKRYGNVWRQANHHQSPAHSDTTRIIVDGGPAVHEPYVVTDADQETLNELARVIGNPEAVLFLIDLCAIETWPSGDKRRFKRICRKGLERLAQHWRRR